MRLIDGDELLTEFPVDDEPMLTKSCVRMTIRRMPTVDAVPVRHGQWEEVPYKTIEHGEVVVRGKTVRCSACRHAEKGWNSGMNYCPMCGARMDGDNHEKAD